MRRLVVKGGWYAAALPSGAYVTTLLNQGTLRTDAGDIALPHGQTNLLWLDMAPGQIVGLGHQDDLAWRQQAGVWSSQRCFACPRSAIFLPDGSLRVVQTSTETGSQGYIQVADDGRLVPTSAHQADLTRRLWEYTTLGDITIGQGGDGPDGDDPLVAVLADGSARLLQRGRCHAIRFKRAGEQLAIAWSQEDQNAAGFLWLTVAELAELPVYRRPASIQAIGRPMWMGFFNFAPAFTPGNATLNTSDLVIRGPQGAAVAQYVAALADSDVDALDKAITAAKGHRLPVVAYWTRQAQAIRLPKGADIVGVEAYRGATESMAAFEARVRAAVARCSSAALICQCYTSNTKNTADLASLVPLYARIAKDCKNVWGLLVFSGSGRATGLQDHPEIRPLWQQLAAGIPSAPPKEDDVNVPGTDVPPTLPKIVKGQRWDLTVKDRNNPGFSTRFLIDETGKLTVTLTNPAGSNPTGLPRQVL